VAGEKEESSEEMGGGTTEWCEEAVGLDWREKWSLEILSEKKLAKVWEREGNEFVKEDGSGWDWLRWSRELTVCQRRRGLHELDWMRSEK
jgi:ribosomal protein L39E